MTIFVNKIFLRQGGAGGIFYGRNQDLCLINHTFTLYNNEPGALVTHRIFRDQIKCQ